ncbi:MAG: beta-propeller domain-containing protein, partial [Marmoricola sp.]
TSTGLPALPFVQPQPGRLTETEATARNREVVRESTIEDWLPGLRSGSTARPVVGCGDLLHPRTPSGTSTVAVATFRPGAVEDATAVGVTGAGGEVYSSADRLYVASTSWGGDDRGWDDRGWGRTRPMTVVRTHLHAFALEGERTRYLASGVVSGTVRDRWSMDEHDGHLRVAVSWPGRAGGPQDNGIVVLDEQDGRLEQVGVLRGLGTNEQIQSVRWFDDLAVVVTFRQMDPLYTVDLSDPTRPETLGALKIPGFSAYLHPVGGDRLLGLGVDATTQGQSLGAQAAVFDLRDRARARQLGKATFGPDSALTATADPHAFTWLPGSRAAITSVQRTNGPDDAVTPVLLRLSPSGELSTQELPSPGGWEQRALPLEDGRVALVGETVRIVSVG